MLVALALPIILSAVALFFASFVSWMVLQLHKTDWVKLDREDEFLKAAAKCDIPVGNYVFPGANTRAEMESEAYKKRYDAGPRGVMTISPKANMAQNLGLTFVYFLAVSVGIAFLASIALRPGAEFVSVFRFVFVAGFMTLLAAMVSHSIWFRTRIVGHVIESVVMAAITASLFAFLWPSA